MKAQLGIVVLAFLAATTANAAFDWMTPYQEMSDEEKADFHDDYDADGVWIGSRYRWIQMAEEFRPVLQKDEDLWRQAVMECELCENFDEARKREYFDLLRRYRDEDNAQVDAQIASLLVDESGSFRRALSQANDESLEKAKVELHFIQQRQIMAAAKKRNQE